MKHIMVLFGFLVLSFSSMAEEGGAPGTICLTGDGHVVTTHLQSCPKDMKKL
ncbi:hypothetical protein [Vibrio methylphosphonaticus]|uniref:hypothetical protein n=1 Tax=Vibrio methylphosphonaticus TaxID=2946866 RepID=UPI00202A5F6E|nr:hypothetical protein [Vibrio methylphosphonaticus]MCL9774178.1 hypothetical protein [Vibrio methylphosphonaticus]